MVEPVGGLGGQGVVQGLSARPSLRVWGLLGGGQGALGVGQEFPDRQ
ncbi:hypothetical protein ACFV2Z_16105 [Streptomyces sp. NPDC059688]